MTIRIGYWDCPSCGTKKNLGPKPTCATCGRPRGPGIPFYTDDTAPVVEDPAMVARARAGADWACKYCGADNRAGDMDCDRCGAGPDGAVRRAEKLVPIASRTAAASPRPKKSSAALVLGVLGALFVVVGAAVWLLFVRTVEQRVTVESVAWVKTAQIEERHVKLEEDWQDEVPAGARVVAKEARRRPKEVKDGIKKVKVGQKDLGNGMFEDIYEEKPNVATKQVEDTWVRYEVETWKKGERLEEKTSDGTEPPDPARRAKTSSDRRVGATTNEAVFFLKSSDGKDYRFEVDAREEGAAAMKRYEVGKSYRAQVNTMGNVSSLSP